MKDIDKIIVTNRSVLIGKYGPAGVKKITAALQKMIRADVKRNIDTKLIFIDDAREMRPSKGHAVTRHDNAQQVWHAIDALYTHYLPDYVMLLGAPDVVPHVPLHNPTAGDDDTIVPSDLPYACPGRYSLNVRQYLAPNRVVGRLPDLNGGTNVQYLLKLIDAAIHHQPQPRKFYDVYFAMGNASWRGSTQKTVTSIFGENKKLIFSPPVKVKNGLFTKQQLSPRLHFFNCHGGIEMPYFFGGKNATYDAFYSENLKDHINPWTVAVAECCYGAMLYNPGEATDRDHDIWPIPNRYLYEGAIAYVGSTTTAYGPVSGQDDADLLTQFFIRSMRRGASCGRAFLEARHRFIEAVSPRIDPVQLKTLAQFILLGDPSVHPVAATSDDIDETLEAMTEVLFWAKREQRHTRREQLALRAAVIEMMATAAVPMKTRRLSKSLHQKVKQALHRFDFREECHETFSFAQPNLKGLTKKRSNMHVHVFSENRGKNKNGTSHVAMLTVSEERGRIVKMIYRESK